MTTIINSPEHITVAWLSEALANHLHGNTIASISTAPIGNGLIADCTKVSITYTDASTNGIASVIIKSTAQDPTSRETAATYGLYLYEVRFYQEFAKRVDIRTPKVYFCDIADNMADFTLLMEDLSPSRAGDQVKGGTLADCHIAVLEIAGLHGPFWGDTSLLDVPWLQQRKQLGDAHISQIAPMAEGFKQRYSTVLEPQYLALIDDLVALYPIAYHDQSAPKTLQHFDYRVDNALFDIGGQADSMATVDWQTILVGPGLTDVAYFIGGALPIKERRANEEMLVKRYYQQLCNYNIGNYTWEQCWYDYRRFAMHGFFMAITAPMTAEQTERGDQLFMEMARRHGDQLLSLKTFDCWR